MTDIFRFADHLGPSKIVHIHVPGVSLRAIVVIDNLARGPGVGGVRMAPDVSVDECFRLARAMTLKNAAAGLAHGGAKSVIQADPSMPPAEKERLIRAFACAIRDLTGYIPGPDMGTNETCMAWVHDEIGRAVGLPKALGGIPLDEIGATGHGLVASIEAARPFLPFDLDGARIAVQGFGAVGGHVARLLTAKGARLVAAADSTATVCDPAGLDVAALLAHKHGGQPFSRLGAARPVDDIIGVACDIWIPAARPDVLRADNVGRLQAKLVAQGANIPATAEAEADLHRRGILVLPDFIANAGGVICAAVEYHGGTEQTALSVIRDRIAENTAAVLERAQRSNMLPRDAAMALAEERVRDAEQHRRWR